MEMVAEKPKDYIALAAEKAENLRLPPHNIEAEQALLGALLLNNEGLNAVGDFLRHTHFYEPVHQRIFDAIQKYYDRGMIATPVTLKTYFDKDETLKEIGGAQYLTRLAASAATIMNIKDFGRAIYDLALKRSLIAIGEEVVNTAYDEHIDRPAMDQIEGAEQKLFNLASEGVSERSFMPLSASLAQAIASTEKAFKNQGQVSGITTGLVDMDKLLGGMHRSDLLILAGRPSMGKTALATCIAYNAAEALAEKARREGKPEKEWPAVGFFSLEMSAEQLAARLISMVTGVSSSKMRRGEVSHEDFAELVRGSQKLGKLPFVIDDTPGLSIAAVRTRARRMKRMHNVGLIVVDYLQLMHSTSDIAKTNRVLEIGEITKGLKGIAKELDVPVIALSQLSRAVEQRPDKRPLLSDLRESGTIEQDADVVMFVFREEYYLERGEPRHGTQEHLEWQERMNKVMGVAEVIVAKHRNGAVGNVALHFSGATTMFSNLVRPDGAAGYESGE